MSIPLDRLYHYIESVANKIRQGDVLIYRFWPHGSKNIEDLTKHSHHDSTTWHIAPELICYDQEPLNYNFYQNCTPLGEPEFIKIVSTVLPKWNLRRISGNIYDKCLLLHSELRSSNVDKYQQDQFIPVYYWSHAIIARDWFRYAIQCDFKKINNYKKIFLIYNRAWTGIREYRLRFADLLIDSNLQNICHITFNPTDSETKINYQDHNFTNQYWKPVNCPEHFFPTTDATSLASADFDIEDYKNTQIEVVLETLFDDNRIQLTEKILRPIACKQPFILVGTHGSLQYLRNYGFKTFDTVFDEDYDKISDPQHRLSAIISIMKKISHWTTAEKQINFQKMQKITEFNHRYFFSDDFFRVITDELELNLTNGLTLLETTNTSRQYLDLQKQYRKIPQMAEYRKTQFLKIPGVTETRETRAAILRLARKYRDRFTGAQ